MVKKAARLASNLIELNLISWLTVLLKIEMVHSVEIPEFFSQNFSQKFREINFFTRGFVIKEGEWFHAIFFK